MTDQLQIHDHPAPPAHDINILTGGNFDRMMRIAEFFAKSDLIPAHFQGKPANVFIALEVAHRHNMSIFAVMQSLYVVHGRPGFEGKFLIALANQAGWNLQYDIVRDGAGNITACTAFSDRGGVKTFGPKVTQAMVKAEGWDRPKGSMTSKWVTMPELMFRYRAGAYFVNVICPQLKMGMPTTEELEDMTVDISPETYEAQALPEVETPPAPEMPSFDAQVSDAGLPQDSVGQYVAAIATHKKVDTDTVIAGAMANWDKFISAFKKWEKKQGTEAATAPPVDDQPSTNGDAPVNGKIVMAASTEQLAEIRTGLKDVNYPEASLCSDYNVSALEELDTDKAGEIITKLKA